MPQQCPEAWQWWRGDGVPRQIRWARASLSCKGRSWYWKLAGMSRLQWNPKRRIHFSMHKWTLRGKTESKQLLYRCSHTITCSISVLDVEPSCHSLQDHAQPAEKPWWQKTDASLLRGCATNSSWAKFCNVNMSKLLLVPSRLLNYI